jgi:predicted LPLAT superfamily acyltransferase
MSGGKGPAARLEALGHWFFYLALRLFGHRGGIVLLVPVMGCYLLASRRIHRLTRHYLRRRFPGESPLAYWRHTCRNLFSFGRVLVERGWLGLNPKARLDSDFIGRDLLIEAVARGRGVVLLTAHVGNWQSALAHLGELPVPVHALMRYDQQAAAKHFFDLRPGPPPFAIIAADGDFGGMVEALAALQRGEMVAIMGDRHVGGPATTVDFLGDPVCLPVAAYQLAAMAGAPVLILLAAQTGLGRSELRLWDHFLPVPAARQKRDQLLADCAGRFSRALEAYLQDHPYQWYNFYNFWKQ